MARKPAAETFPKECCAACRFCLSDKSGSECWAQPPAQIDPEYEEQSPPHPRTRGRPVDPKWPPCVFFHLREHA